MHFFSAIVMVCHSEGEPKEMCIKGQLDSKIKSIHVHGRELYCICWYRYPWFWICLSNIFVKAAVKLWVSRQLILRLCRGDTKLLRSLWCYWKCWWNLSGPCYTIVNTHIEIDNCHYVGVFFLSIWPTKFGIHNFLSYGFFYIFNYRK